MHRLLSAIALAVALGFSSAAHSQNFGDYGWRDLGRIKSSLACSASEVNRTWTARAGEGAGYAMGVFQFDLTWEGATNVLWTCYGSLNSGTTWALLQSCAVSAGTCTSSTAVWNRAVTENVNILWRVHFLGASDVKCIFSCTGPVGADAVNIWGRLSE